MEIHYEKNFKTGVDKEIDKLFVDKEWGNKVSAEWRFRNMFPSKLHSLRVLDRFRRNMRKMNFVFVVLASLSLQRQINLCGQCWREFEI